ncbi:hypothetical protein LPUS_06270 [Lasallia pustulata]|uniref:Uncharacterized protein n=1 Tax=Lasallia pustulata TaxID=136370 RepID=A0A1W5D0I9_9LECA|nr:hypothetical protein LPUS_06270 [Lasallia pustulata]
MASQPVPTSTPLSSLTPSSSSPAPHQLPPLPYRLRDHKRNIAIIWTLLALDAAILPLVLFYPLWFASDLNPAYIFAVTTSVFGLISGAEWAVRTWLLWRWEGLRPLGVDGPGGRWAFDFFHWSYSIGYTIALIELIIGAAPFRPIVRLCALPAPSFILFFGLLLLTFQVYCHLGFETPFRISSLPRGVPMRPLIYTILEDVIAVDTKCGRGYREQLKKRYEASPMFRGMLKRLNLFWGLPATVLGAGIVALVWIPQVPETVAYGIGWGVPPLWIGLWVVITIWWVQSALRKEKEEWCKHGTIC